MTDIDPIISKNLWEPLKDLDQITTGSGRWYSFPDTPEEKYFSVTTIIDHSKSISSKKAINDWKNKEIAEGNDPDRYSKDGDVMHSLIEHYYKSGYSQPPKEKCKGRGYRLYKQYNDNFLSTNYIIPHLIEGRLYTNVEGMKYAGTVDLVATIQTAPESKKELVIIDHKSIKTITSASSKKKGYLPQLAAYAKAVKDRYGKTVDAAYLNFASEKGFKSYRIDMSELLDYWDEFYYKLHKFYKDMK